MKLRKFVEEVADKIDIVFNHSLEIVPMWHIIAGDGEELILPSIAPDKDMACLFAQAFMAVTEAKRYVFIDEGWMAFVKDESKIPISGGVKEIPGRKEIVMFMAEDIDEGTIMAHREIIRPEGKRPYLGPIKISDSGGVSEGRFCGLLPVKKLHS